MTVDDIIEELVEDGMELNPATVKDVITRFNKKSMDSLLRGYRVSNGLVHMHITVGGVFYNKIWNADQNSVYVAISQSKELRQTVANADVEILGEHPNPMAIFTLTDLSTKLTDGSITRRFNVEIKGTYIKVAGDDPACGIYFRNEDRQIEYKLPDEYLVLNEPSRLLILVPENLEPDSYELRVVTQYTNSKQQLKTTRSATYKLPITVI
jgi:hypothetical protein